MGRDQIISTHRALVLYGYEIVGDGFEYTFWNGVMQIVN